MSAPNFDLFSNAKFSYYSDPDLSTSRDYINQAYHCDEEVIVKELVDKIQLTQKQQIDTQIYATEFVQKIRQQKIGHLNLDAFLLQYDLSSSEGTALMCLAEALLRIPDSATRDKLIRDKICRGDWSDHAGKSKVFFVNAATYAFMFTAKVIKNEELTKENLTSSLTSGIKKLLAKGGMPVVRTVAGQAMKILGNQFVMAENINKALFNALEWEEKGYAFSYDMLGEAARTDEDADYYYKEYCEAITEIAKSAKNSDLNKNPGISIKLSAIDARYELVKPQRINNNLISRLKNLCLMAKEANIGLTVDAEESDRLDISLDIFEQVFKAPELRNWGGLGLAVQAYQKRAFRVLVYLQKLSAKYNKKIMLRLVKGAYWDSEIKNAQVKGLNNYPVYTKKSSTDVSYLACAKFLLDHTENFYPQFATHNAHTLSAILALTTGVEAQTQNRDFEFQRLHGMGEALYEQVVGKPEFNSRQCRIYAPVGGYKHLLAYLVRRLLENGANSSFVNRIIDENLPIELITKSPIIETIENNCTANPKIKLPKDILTNRINSMGLDLSDLEVLNQLSKDIAARFSTKKISNQYDAGPVVNNINFIEDQELFSKLEVKTIVNPADHQEIIGKCYMASKELAEQAITAAFAGFNQWSKTTVQFRANCLVNMADLLEENMAELIGLCVKEAGKTVPNAISEVREAVDFCRYYANIAIELMGTDKILPGPTGELNKISMNPRGVFACISPWNFPLAIFLGQIVAALVTGNTVIAKPAEQTPLIAYFAVNLLYQAGIPKSACHFLPGSGSELGPILTSSNKIAGVIFTGSGATANLINKSLANRGANSSIATVIAETGGLNTMIVDSSALPEQVVRDVLLSAFDSAGQRCSALRLLYVQEDIADNLINMLIGAMRLLTIGNPQDLSVDVGPVIDEDAKAMLIEHLNTMDNNPDIKCLYKAIITDDVNNKGTYVPLGLYELNNANLLQEEFFGPILHVVRYKSHDLDAIIDSINNTGYGLTFGVHSRIDETINYICSKVNAGNCYVNRNMIGAVVGVQPFGGNGLSGTGPKAGGEHYLARLCSEKTISIDTTASGGNASLLCLD